MILVDLHRSHKLKTNSVKFIIMRSVEVMKPAAWKNIALPPATAYAIAC